MNPEKTPYDFSKSLEIDIPRISNEYISTFEKNIETRQILQYIYSLYEKEEPETETSSPKTSPFDDFINYWKTNIPCKTKNCPTYNTEHPHLACSFCLLRLVSITPMFFEGNLLLNAPLPPFFFIGKTDLLKLTKTIATKYPLVTEATLRSIIEALTNYIKNTPSLNKAEIVPSYSKIHKIIYYQISKVLFSLSEALKIITSASSWETETKTGTKSFSKFLLKNYGILEPEIIPIKQAYESTKNDCNQQLSFLTKNDNPFSKLVSIFFAISNGKTQPIDDLAVMIAKIFIGRTYLKTLDPENSLTNFTIIQTNSPEYIKDFLINIFSADFTFTDLNNINMEQILSTTYSYDNSKAPYIPTQKISCEPLTSERSSDFLCNEDNLGDMVRDKLSGKIVNVDISATKITSPNFTNLLNVRNIYSTNSSIPLNNKLSYKNNSHYIKISSASIDNIIDASFDHNLYTFINFEGYLANAKYEPLYSYEIFFLVTGFVEYGIDLLLKQLSTSNSSAKQSINNNESISSFINEFYLDTFDIKKASFNQKEDTNDFATADDDLYENYKRWFNSTYNNVACCSPSQFKNVLKDLYKERPAKKNSSLENDDELSQRYLKLNKMSCRGVSGLKFQKDKFDSFLTDKQKQTLDPSEKKRLFNTYLSSLFTKYSPYSK